MKADKRTISSFLQGFLERKVTVMITLNINGQEVKLALGEDKKVSFQINGKAPIEVTPTDGVVNITVTAVEEIKAEPAKAEETRAEESPKPKKVTDPDVEDLLRPDIGGGD